MGDIQDKEKQPDGVKKYFQRKNGYQDPFIWRRYSNSIHSQKEKQQGIGGQTEEQDDMQSEQGE